MPILYMLDEVLCGTFTNLKHIPEGFGNSPKRYRIMNPNPYPSSNEVLCGTFTNLKHNPEAFANI